MQFLKTLFWVALAVAIVLFATVNWHAVTINLWGGLEADVKLPVLALGMFLLGFLPTWLFYRARLWNVRRRMEALERQVAAVQMPPAAPAAPVAAQPETAPEPIFVDNRTAPSQ